ncbi:MAG TPA: hypothetical protein DDW52_15715 [Planctomycetaceae bacterium]|nr:hypothetical protein [Planctomycetaceae bacterium]
MKKAQADPGKSIKQMIVQNEQFQGMVDAMTSLAQRRPATLQLLTDGTYKSIYSRRFRFLPVSMVMNFVARANVPHEIEA